MNMLLDTVYLWLWTGFCLYHLIGWEFEILRPSRLLPFSVYLAFPHTILDNIKMISTRIFTEYLILFVTVLRTTEKPKQFHRIATEFPLVFAIVL